MAAGLNIQYRAVAEFRTDQVQRLGAFGKAGQDIDVTQRGGAILQRRQMLPNPVHQLLVQQALPGEGAGARGQGFVFEGLQFGGDEALGIFQGLPPHIAVGRIDRLAL